MINGFISQYYFSAIMKWDFEAIWYAAVAQGIFEGLIYGIIFACFYTTAFALITKAQATYTFAFKQLLFIVLFIFSTWIIGGLIAIFISCLSPDFYKAQFPMTPVGSSEEMIKFAWVGGSIWGAMFGGLLAMVLGIIRLKNSWTKLLAS